MPQVAVSNCNDDPKQQQTKHERERKACGTFTYSNMIDKHATK